MNLYLLHLATTSCRVLDPFLPSLNEYSIWFYLVLLAWLASRSLNRTHSKPHEQSSVRCGEASHHRSRSPANGFFRSCIAGHPGSIRPMFGRPSSRTSIYERPTRTEADEHHTPVLTLLPASSHRSENSRRNGEHCKAIPGLRCRSVLLDECSLDGARYEQLPRPSPLRRQLHECVQFPRVSPVGGLRMPHDCHVQILSGAVRLRGRRRRRQHHAVPGSDGRVHERRKLQTVSRSGSGWMSRFADSGIVSTAICLFQ